MAERILVVEDDEGLREGLAFNLTAAGFEVEVASSAAAALERLAPGGIHAVILDVMLPDGSGFGVLEKLRARDDRVPVLLLTSRSLETDKVRGLELGADDYVTKPFGLAELVARVRALLRRARPGDERPAATPAAVALGSVTVDLARCEATRGRERLPLSRYEAELLRLFFAHPGRVFSRNELLNLVWGYDRFPTTRTVDNHMARLRKKIEAAPEEPRFLVTVHGIGYRYDPPG